ncbi:MAG: 16S rRNA (uracil(1498)-N(3))-methyltransferase [Aestuariivirga sp.]|jgi:16S rRNA (uracil1498-N3)-methyltransferase|uniref:16S rRNA (uracil(1498)-N(3))-methyltransferase n=1 Tax=Aestuariivirga sp. TaxID=2650926 RepID=UPI0038D07AA0
MKTTPRLHVDAALNQGAEIALPREQAHYLTGVLRLSPGDPVEAFNGRDGAWLAYLAPAGKKDAALRCERKLSDVTPPPDIDYCFAPLKHARLDYVVQKATELGARRLRPVITQRTVAERVNLARMRANAVEAAEQCNLVFVPDVMEPVKLAPLIAAWEPGRALVYCDETAAIANPLDALKHLRAPAAVLVGPEGGFTKDEKAMLRSLPFVTAISLGPRIMRADTAAVAALAVMQAVLGDWHAP